ncbi:MAG: NUDIX hydrolase [Candidatus Levybacteria bacterium]|nr:NUDIX hydrolase [Candidatus Levybacteria bacterium]
MKNRVVVTAIIEKDDKILMGKKTGNVGPYPNTWHLIGGGVNLGEESAMDAIKREIEEETGLKVKEVERVGFDEDFETDKHGEMTHYIFLIYKTKITSKVALPGDDIIKLEWIDKSKLKEFPLTRPSAKYFKEIGLI